MKLRNKKTGDIVDIADLDFSLAELNDEWCDYEEPKEYWYIDDAGVIQIDQVLSSEINMRKSIGNYFETREEAEKAVEKLKAWKRLKDKGFRFFNNKIIGEYGNVSYTLTYPVTKVEEKDLDLLTGGEE